jgi:kumamolisin
MAVYVPLAGSKKSLLPNSRHAGPVNPSELTTLTVRVRSAGDPKALEKRVYEQAARPLAEREYLTHEQLAEQHGASKEDLDKVEAFAQQHDLFVVHRSAAARTIQLRGKLSDLRAAYHADVGMYHHSTGTYRGRQGEIAVPQELQSIITGVFGFDTRPKHRAAASGRRSPQSRRKASGPSGANHKAASGKDGGRAVAASGSGGQNGVASTEFASRYNFPTQFNGTKLDGTGQTIAIIELGGGYRTSDLKVFFNEIGVPMPAVASISVDSAADQPTTPDSADGEVMLDIEVAGAVAPNAKFAIYFAPNNGDKGFIDAISAAVHDTERKPNVISISWGGPEDPTDQMSNNEYHDLFAAAGALGITVCIATGDHGTADLDAAHWDHKIHVDHPACDDLVLACGGTQIENGSDVVWNDHTPFDPNIAGGGGWASGGGISAAFGVPSYQTAANKVVSIDDGKPGRGIPDIAMSATGYFTRVDNQERASSGTSAVAPLMAALVALLNEAKQKNVGFLNPFLYSNVAKGVVHEVTSGTNAITNSVKGYDAGPGWDPCSGLGTPDGTAMLTNL